MQAVFAHAHRGGCRMAADLHRLHGGDHAVVTKSGQILCRDDFGLFDPPASIPGIGQRQFLDREQHFFIGAVAGGANRGLKIVERGAAHPVAQLRGAHLRNPPVCGGIGIGRFQRGTARAQRSVKIEHHAIEPQPVIIQPRRGARAADQFHHVRRIGIGHNPQPQIAQITSPAIGHPVDQLGPHIGNRCHPIGEQFLLRQSKGDGSVFGAGRGHFLRD